jgi:hypothetical protein
LDLAPKSSGALPRHSLLRCLAKALLQSALPRHSPEPTRCSKISSGPHHLRCLAKALSSGALPRHSFLRCLAKARSPGALFGPCKDLAGALFGPCMDLAGALSGPCVGLVWVGGRAGCLCACVCFLCVGLCMGHKGVSILPRKLDQFNAVTCTRICFDSIIIAACIQICSDSIIICM